MGIMRVSTIISVIIIIAGMATTVAVVASLLA